MQIDPIDIVKICKECGLRLTGQRRVIVEVLQQARDHPDALELHRRATKVDPRIALSTIYRTLSLLEEKGILERHIFGGGPARFERADAEHHDHFIDVESGRVVEFRSDQIEQLQQQIAQEHGFEIISHRLEIYVKPAKARKRKPEEAPRGRDRSK
ncbi:MAG: transcriptional repressor [Rhizobiaceae bacterium]|nr:MAG: transcriptional repressor [Rhizobiaceae bacterium]